MRIDVLVAVEPPATAEHEGPWVDAESVDGELRVTSRDLDNRVISWTLYAAGRWVEAWLVEPASEDVQRHRQAMEEQRRTGAPNPYASPALYGPVGNSGPY